MRISCLCWERIKGLVGLGAKRLGEEGGGGRRGNMKEWGRQRVEVSHLATERESNVDCGTSTGIGSNQ